MCTATATRSRLSASGKTAYLALCRHAVAGHDRTLKSAAARQCQQIIKQTTPAAVQASLIADCPKP